MDRAGRLLLFVVPAASMALGFVLTVVGGTSVGAVEVDEAPPVEEIYLRDCAACHGAEGTGTHRGPSLEGVGRASVDYYVSTGRMPLVEGGRVPSAGSPIEPLPERHLGDPSIAPRRHDPAYPPPVVDALVDHVTELVASGGPDIPEVDVAGADLAAGGEAFRLQCAACHAWGAEGGALLEREAPALHESTPRQIGEAIRIGPGTMPVFGEAALSADELDDVAAYVRYLADPDDRGGQPLWHLGPVSEGAVAWAVGLSVLVLLVFRIGERG